jgi:hypothetical protein
MRIILTAILALSVATSAIAAEKYHFKPRMKENASYKVTSRTNLAMEFDSKGVSNPHNGSDGSMGLNMNAKFDAVLDTKGEVEGKGIPFEYRFNSVDYDMKSPGLEDIMGEIPKMDSILMSLSPINGYVEGGEARFVSGDPAVDMKLNAKNAMGDWIFPSMNSITSMIDHEVSPGDTIKIGTSLDIPGNPFGAKMEYTANYKLNSVRDGKAYFDIDYNIVRIGDKDAPPMPFNFSITGIGNAVYDLNEDFFIVDAANVTANMSMNYGQDMGLDMVFKLDQYTDTKLD